MNNHGGFGWWVLVEIDDPLDTHTPSGLRAGDTMEYDPKKHHRRSIRLAGYNYAQGGAYFVTVCTQDRRCLFGQIVDGRMEWNAAGRAADQCWRDIPTHFPQVALDEFIVMPNHVHGILIRTDPSAANRVGANNHSPLQDRTEPRPRGTSQTIGSIIRGFKIGVTKWMRENTGVGDVWQRNYYESIIRNDESLNRIRQYIMDNPASWMLDRENPQAKFYGQEEQQQS